MIPSTVLAILLGDRSESLRLAPRLCRHEDARASLGGVYGGPIWKMHREAANATMIDSDNVLLFASSPTGRRVFA